MLFLSILPELLYNLMRYKMTIKNYLLKNLIALRYIRRSIQIIGIYISIPLDSGVYTPSCLPA